MRRKNEKDRKAMSPNEFVRAARQRLKLSQTALTRRLGLSTYQTVLNYEKGYTNVPAWVILRLKEILKERNIKMRTP